MGKGYGLNSRKDHKAQCIMIGQFCSPALDKKIITSLSITCPVCYCQNQYHPYDPMAYSVECYNCLNRFLFIFRKNHKLDEESQKREWDYWLELMEKGEHIYIVDDPKPKKMLTGWTWAN